MNVPGPCEWENIAEEEHKEVGELETLCIHPPQKNINVATLKCICEEGRGGTVAVIVVRNASGN